MKSSSRLSDAEFKRRHAEHIASYWWKEQFRPKALEHYGHRCAVCGLGYATKYNWRQLHVDHKRYWKDGKLIFGRETMEDVRLRCPDCDSKGVASDYAIKLWKNDLRWVRAFGWLMRFPVRVLRFLIGV